MLKEIFEVSDRSQYKFASHRPNRVEGVAVTTTSPYDERSELEKEIIDGYCKRYPGSQVKFIDAVCMYSWSCSDGVMFYRIVFEIEKTC